MSFQDYTFCQKQLLISTEESKQMLIKKKLITGNSFLCLCIIDKDHVASHSLTMATLHGFTFSTLQIYNNFIFSNIFARQEY